MPNLSFHIDLSALDIATQSIPVDVRKKNQIVVNQGQTSDIIADVKPGAYYVTAYLPDGEQLTQHVEVNQQDVLVNFTESAATEPRVTRKEVRALSGRINRFWSETPHIENVMSLMSVHKVIPLAGDQPAEARFRIYERLPGSGAPYVPVSVSSRARSGDSASEVVIGGSDRNTILQVLQPDHVPVNTLLPAGITLGQSPVDCYVRFERNHEGACAASIRVNNADAQGVLEFRAMGALESIAIKTGTPSSMAHDLLSEKVDDPIGAMIGAYALLRTGRLDRLHAGWTHNLSEMFPWLPDGSVLYGEHLARVGDHQNALACFLQAPERGLPIMSSGFSYAVDRLRLYTTEKNGQFSEADLSRARTELVRLCAIADYVDYRGGFLTFTGLDPNAPDERKIGLTEFIDALETQAAEMDD